MSAPLSRTRRLSSVWDNFRNKYRKTRIDSLLSPPNLDSGDDKKSGYSDLEGKLLPSDYDSDRSPGSTGRQSFSEDEVVSPCDSKLPDFQFPPAISGFEVGGRRKESLVTNTEDARGAEGACEEAGVGSRAVVLEDGLLGEGLHLWSAIEWYG